MGKVVGLQHHVAEFGIGDACTFEARPHGVAGHHRVDGEQLADRVCVLDQGSIKLIDTPENLKADFKMNNLEDVFVLLTGEEIS